LADLADRSGPFRLETPGNRLDRVARVPVPAHLISATLAGEEPLPARGASVRPKKNLQEPFDFRPSDLKITKQHFGHMVQIEQVESKFVTGYAAFRRRPNEADLVEPALSRHVELFGHEPQSLAADKGYYRSMDEIHRLEKQVDVVSIGKKGRRNSEEEARESSAAFKLAQAFRSGVEGTISYLKRSLRLARCFNKGWEHYQATVGATIFGHNLLVLARC
jgi:hypothetical protein